MKTLVDTYEVFAKSPNDQRHAWRRRWEVRFRDFSSEKEADQFLLMVERLLKDQRAIVDRLTGL